MGAMLASIRATRPSGRTVLLAAVVLLLPLEVSKVLFPIQQVEFARILMAVGITWALLRVARGARPVPFGLGIAVALTVVVTVGSFLLTRWADGVLEAVAVPVYAAFMVFVADALEDDRSLVLVAVALVASGACTSLIAIGQVVLGFYLWREGQLDVLGRANATFGDPNVFARVLVICLIAGLGLLASHAADGRRIRAGLLAVLALMTAGLVETQSRTGWAVFALMVLAWLVVALRIARVRAGLVVIIVAFAVASVLNPNGLARPAVVVEDILGSVADPDPAGDATYAPPRDVPGYQVIRALPLDGVRLYLIEAGIAMWQDHPWFGVGTGGFLPMMTGPYRAFIPPERFETGAPGLPHTSLGQVTAEHGYAGLAALVVLAAAVAAAGAGSLRSGDRDRRVAAFSTLSAIVVVFLASQFAGRLHTEPYLWLALGVLAALARRAALVPGVTAPR